MPYRSDPFCNRRSYPEAGSRDKQTAGPSDVSVDELSWRIARAVTDKESTARVTQESIRAFLTSDDSPLVADDRIRYDESDDVLWSRRGRLGIRIDRGPLPGVSWRQYYTVLPLVGVALVLAHRFGTPILGELDPLWVVSSVLLLVLAGSLYQMHAYVDTLLN